MPIWNTYWYKKYVKIGPFEAFFVLLQMYARFIGLLIQIWPRGEHKVTLTEIHLWRLYITWRYFLLEFYWCLFLGILLTGQHWSIPDSKVHGTNMGPTWVLSAPVGPHVDPVNLAIWDVMTWCRTGNRPLSEPMMIQSTDIQCRYHDMETLSTLLALYAKNSLANNR